MSDQKVLLQIKNLTHHYDKRLVLAIDSLAIRSGCVLGLVGPNGSGKSTLLRLLGLLEPIRQGELFFKGENTAGAEGEMRREVTLLLQESYLLKRSVFENVAYGLRVRGETQGIQECVQDAMQRVGLAYEEFANRRWYQLSGGEIQRVALAARLILRPTLLLLDEPTANVDEKSALLIQRAVLSVWEEWGTTVVVSTHDATWLNQVTTDICCLCSGRIVGEEVVNILPTPWTPHNGGSSFSFSETETMYSAHKGADEQAIAVLSPSEITFISEAEKIETTHQNILRGTLLQIQDQRNRRLLAQVLVGEYLFRVLVSTERARALSLLPGQRVGLTFSHNAIHWFPQ